MKIKIAGTGLTLVVFGVLVAVSMPHNANRNANGDINKKGALDAISLRAGDCYEKPADPTVPFSSVKAIPCTQPHDAQAYFSFKYMGPISGAGAPSDDDLQNNAMPQCDAARKAKVDESKVPQDSTESILLADDSTWQQGYNDITCVIETNTDKTGSVVKG